MRLIFCRHGDPDYSIDSLTQQGFVEAELLAKRLLKENVDAVFCSPLGRAKDTMKPYLEFSGKSAEICDWLEEFNYCKIADPLTGEERTIWDFKPEFLDNNRDFYDREKWFDIDFIKNSKTKTIIEKVWEGLDNCLENFGYKRDGYYYNAVNSNHKTLLFFCHFGLEAILLSHLFNTSPQVVSHNFFAAPSSVTILISEEREKGKAYFRCNSFGDISHLYADNENPSFSGRFCECFSDDTRH